MLKGVRSSISDLMYELSIAVIHYRGLVAARRFWSSVELKLNLGCGGSLKDGWINVDLNGQADVRLDLRERMPFSAESCAMIYSEHFLEHLWYPTEAYALLKESYRILKPGGLFSVGVPDTEWPIRAYIDQDDVYFRIAKEQWHPPWCRTRIEHINYHFRQGTEHKFAYDFETLEVILRRAGFINVRRRPFNPELDSKCRELGTLYVDAFKPE